uniref:YLP motif-containing protein 1 n=1 Tax=Amphilophus citrinellus TaxID=61819 RepID=A0A3Q0QZG3_AMPCI
MYPSWGNYGAPQSQNYGGSGPRKPPTGSHTGQAAGFGGFEASSSGSLFSSLQEQHLQQMQQLQMLHQKQLQSVLQHGAAAAAPPPPPPAPAYSAGLSGGYMGSSWHSEGSAHVDSVAGAQSYFKQEETPAPPTRAPPAPKQGHQQPPPPPPQPHPTETQPIPPPPEPQPSKPPENSGPEVPKDPEEAARLQQLQAAAAQWQQVQQQRAGLQYQALMQQHEKLQQILEQYQHLIQQPPNLQSMSAEMQLRHYEMQQQQFTPLFQDWNHSFTLWHEQFQNYPHKDQLQDYEHQWKQWKEQMNATNAHLQERVATLTAMVPFASSQYNSGMLGQYGQYPAQDISLQQPVNPGMQQSPVAVGPRLQGPQPASFVTHSESPAGPSVRGSGPSGIAVRPPVSQVVQPPSFNNVRGPRGNDPRFEQPQQRFDGPPRFDQPQQRFDGPPRFDQPQQRFDGPPRFDHPQHRFDGPPRFDQPRHRFDGPPRFDQQRQRFDGPPRFDQPRFGQQPRFDSIRHTGPSPRLECPPMPLEKQQQGTQPKVEPAASQPPTVESKTPGKSADKSQSENEKGESKSDNKSTSEDMTDDNLLGTEGFFVQNDPIPQTLQTDSKPDDSNGNDTSNNCEKPDSVNSKPSVTTSSVVTSNATTQNSHKPDGTLVNSKPPQIPKSSGIQPEPQGSVQKQPRLDLPNPPPGRGRGQPPVPSQVQGRGRGQRGSGEFTGPNTVPIAEELGDMPYDYMPPEENLGMQEEQEDYYWQDPSHELFGGEESEIPPEEMWMPEEHHFTEEEYYQEHWEEPESTEYLEDEDPYWIERRPPMRGMRPPFPPGRGRPPRGHPGFMPQGQGRPPYPPHGPMDHEPLGHGMESDDANMDPSRHPMYHGHEPPSHPMHPDVVRGRRRVPPPHEMMDHLEEPLYDEETEGELGWQPPHGRGPPPPPHEILDREGLRRRPMGRGIARGMWRPRPTHEDYEEGYKEGYAVDYDHGEDGYRWRPPPDYRPDDYRRDARYHESEWDMEHALPERDYPPRMPPPEPFRETHWQEERERGHPYQYDELDRGRGELRIREYRDEPPYRKDEPPYPPPSDWDRPSRLPPPLERGYPTDYEDRRPRYEEQREELPLDIPPPAAAPVTNLPESSVEASGANVLALSQRQHEIILKAAQELKLIRELQEGKTPTSESQPAQTDVMPDLPAGLLGLEIPPEVRNGMTATTQTAAEPVSLDTKPAATHYKPSLPTVPATPVIPKTVDYGHGHEPGTTVERISYGERIVLRPDPVPSDRGYEKGSRDPYYERRSDPYMDRREYSREREYREKPDYERERFDRERYPMRERDDRSPLASSLRSGYRERDRDARDRERSGSRDPDEHYGRPGYDRPPYERRSLNCQSYHTVDRRSYPEDRGPPTAPPIPPPPPPQPPPRVEKKPEIKNIDDILKLPGRLSRPERIVIIMRGLPGSGKSHVAKLIRDKEVECGGAPPRVLVLDDYFMTEVEKVEKDPDTGKRVKTKVMEYEYEPEMEDTYRSSMLKTFKKTLDDGFFPFIILDTINDRVKHFDQFWSAAKTKGFEVYLAEITADTQTCAKRNVHGRILKDIMKMSNNWEPSPRHMVRLDVRSLLQDAAIEEVEMEDFNPDDEPKEPKREEEEESDLGYIPKSKWEMDTSEAKLDKLDGLGSSGKRKREGEHMAGLEDYLQLPDDYATRMSEPGKKRVRWADLEEQKDADRKRAIGFVVGQTDWERITDESGQLAQRALNRTKYF